MHQTTNQSHPTKKILYVGATCFDEKILMLSCVCHIFLKVNFFSSMLLLNRS